MGETEEQTQIHLDSGQLGQSREGGKCEEGKTKELASGKDMGLSFGHNKVFVALQGIFCDPPRIVLAHKLGSLSHLSTPNPSLTLMGL